MTATEKIPTFETPQPKGSQVLARKLAGRALGLGKDAPAEAVFDALATQVGGYQQLEQGRGSASEYQHPDAQPRLRPGTPDETIDPRTNFVSGYKDSREFGDSTGAFLEDATLRTASGDRKTGEKAKTLRGKLARRLVKHAVKGVGPHGHMAK